MGSRSNGGRLIRSVYLGKLSFSGTAVDCHGVHWGWQATRPITGRAWRRCTPRTLRLYPSHGRAAAGELDCDAGDRCRGKSSALDGLTALTGAHGDRAAFQKYCGWG